MIELKNITKKYGSLTVYSDFSLSFEEGKITCILGESGSGKTTLLNMIAGLTDYSGEITPRLRCSYVFQEPRLVPNLTVSENLMFICRDRAAVSRMLQEVGLSDKADAYPAALSGGQAQRASLARAFLYPSQVILMDEPFSSLDLALKLKMAELFLGLMKRQRRAAIFVTHDADEALMLADRIIVLKKGAVCGEFYPEGEPCANLLKRNALRPQLLEKLL